MSKLTLIIAIVFSGILMQAQNSWDVYNKNAYGFEEKTGEVKGTSNGNEKISQAAVLIEEIIAVSNNTKEEVIHLILTEHKVYEDYLIDRFERGMESNYE